MGRRKARTGIAVEAGKESVLRIPAWLGEAVLLGKYWLDSGLVGYLEKEVRVVRGRMGRYEVMDFVLLLISYAISGERTIAEYYQALETAKVKQRLADADANQWQRIEDSASQLLDLGYIEEVGRGYPAPMRVIVIRTPRQEHKAKIGKRVQDQVYELFLTSQSAASLSGMEVLSLYRGRGGFEQRLSEEDQEQDYDRWCSWNWAGQELWQIVGQWSWNWRLWMGCQQEPVELRQTVWAKCEYEGESLEGCEHSRHPDVELPPSLVALQGVGKLSAVKSGSDAATGVLYGAMRISTEWGTGLSGKNRFGNNDFQIVNDQTVLCPAGHQMYRRMRHQKPNGDIKIQYGINPKHCQKCPVRKRCLAPKSKADRGRRVTVIRPVISDMNPDLPRVELSKDSALVRSVVQWVGGKANQAVQPILWCDIAATRLWRGWHQQLALFEVKITEIPALFSTSPSEAAKLISRREREHHRLSWRERNERNMRKGEQKQWKVVLPEVATKLLKGLEQLSKRSFVATG